MRKKIVSKGFFKYAVEDGKARILYYHGSSKIVVIPKTANGYAITSIGWGAFLRCESLLMVVIPDSVTRIGRSAFYGCKNLLVIVIPDSVIDIGELAFGKCFGLREIKMNGYHPVYTFFGGALFDKTKGLLLSYFGKKGASSYIVPSFVTGIAHRAFMECPTLENVEIPDSVRIIENIAFYGCKRLSRVTFGNSITSIEKGVFCDCRKLKEVILPKSVISIGARAFDKHVVIKGVEGSCTHDYAIAEGHVFRVV